MNKIADDGYLFVCTACGKTSTTRYGFRTLNEGSPLTEKHESTASPGWDESCMLNAREFAIKKLVWNANGTRVVEVRP